MTDLKPTDNSNTDFMPTSVSDHSSFLTRAGSTSSDGASATDKKLQEEQEQYKNLLVNMEKRRDDFLVYLEQSGVLDKLSKVLLRMFEESILPADPIAYIKKLIAHDDFSPDLENLQRLSQEIKIIKTEIAGLTEENKKLRTTLSWTFPRNKGSSSVHEK